MLVSCQWHGVQFREFRLALYLAADATVAAAQSTRLRADDARPGVEYGDQLHDQHQLAVLFGREHAELSIANGRPRVA